ncbi:PAS/PAC sensor-containing signal transduction diguanylate cyclase [Oleiphilus messinensis]|uniref:PAS/PAC sensor-containing signal transduction diguanylate cyclase n=1 Tax=Oleiphilus messinensis TaxID=141451 RepID=A0A1Y0IBS7_9GAMM|nr:diguanylate cyclase [Oleiphilus messinensis]ARU56915.1 PAS/PAC sensor-containing signal transduction diguanylate cyclase [Oleiphilus messinensis]
MEFPGSIPGEVVLNSLPVSILVIDNAGYIRYVNRTLLKLFKYEQSELINQSLSILLPPEAKSAHADCAARYFSSKDEKAMNKGRLVSGVASDGELLNLEIGLTALESADSEYALATILSSSSSVLRINAYYDELTGLPKRFLFKEMSSKSIQACERKGNKFALLFIDLDGFKLVNDNLGHIEGDRVLRMVAKELQSTVRRSDIVGRVGGDEFVVFMSDIESVMSARISAQRLRDKIRGLALPQKIDASIGLITSDCASSHNLDDLIEMADQLMYVGKRSGKGRVVASNTGSEAENS